MVSKGLSTKDVLNPFPTSVFPEVAVKATLASTPRREAALTGTGLSKISTEKRLTIRQTRKILDASANPIFTQRSDAITAQGNCY